MWTANFVFCAALQGCLAVTFDDQTDFLTKSDCEEYAERKSDLVVEKMNEKLIVGKIYYGCKFKGDGLKVSLPQVPQHLT